MEIDYGDEIVTKNNIIGVVVGFAKADQIILKIDENVRVTIPKTVIKTVYKERQHK